VDTTATRHDGALLRRSQHGAAVLTIVTMPSSGSPLLSSKRDARDETGLPVGQREGLQKPDLSTGDLQLICADTCFWCARDDLADDEVACVAVYDGHGLPVCQRWSGSVDASVDDATERFRSGPVATIGLGGCVLGLRAFGC
jgi:hypothetical protein